MTEVPLVPDGGSLARRPLPDLIAERLTAAIVSGKLLPGQRLPSEPQLARLMGVGRSSLREALSKLQVSGAVEVLRGRGTFVRYPREDDPRLRFAEWTSREGFAVAEVLEARIGLEVSAAGIAAVRATDTAVADLYQRCVSHRQAHLDGSLASLVATDEMFHAALMGCARNEVLEQMYAPLVTRFTEFRRRTLSLSGAGTRSTADHFAIHAAIAAGNPGAARRAAGRHLSTLYSEVLSGASADLRMQRGDQNGVGLLE